MAYSVPMSNSPTRYAKIGATPERVRPYLPDNYRVRTWGPGVRPGSTVTIIEGEDVAGWTLDDYVLPRLQSGLYFGQEIFPFDVVAEYTDADMKGWG